MVSACDFSMRDMWNTPSSLAWPMIQAAMRFETRLAVVCLIGLHLLQLCFTICLFISPDLDGRRAAVLLDGAGHGLGGAALWVELSHPKKVDLVEKDCRWERRGGSCSVISL
jgi:hypothetical protein